MALAKVGRRFDAEVIVVVVAAEDEADMAGVVVGSIIEKTNGIIAAVFCAMLGRFI